MVVVFYLSSSSSSALVIFIVLFSTWIFNISNSGLTSINSSRVLGINKAQPLPERESFFNGLGCTYYAVQDETYFDTLP